MIIPEGTSVLIPPYTIQRDPRYFSPNPDRFWPERWILKDKGSDFRLNQNAFIAFSTGPANCVGKHLAMLEMRLVITHIMQTFDIRLAEGYDPSQWAKELKDYFVLHKGSLPVVLVDRSSK
jgi:cytochrome P450